jgi:hypothetical protein
MDFIADQLAELFGTHFCLAFTLPPTSWLDYSVLTSSPTSWSDCSSFGLHRQLRWRLASYVGDSLVFGFFVQELPDKLGILLAVGFCYVSLVG